MIPMLDLKRQYVTIKDEVLDAIGGVCESQQFILGETVERFEQEFAEKFGANHAVGVSSGTDALTVALMAAGIGQGEEVITTPFTFFATAGAIHRVGATPVFADIDPRTFNIDAGKASEAVTSKTKAIIPVHLFGQCCDMEAILDSPNVWLIEDACQSVGAACNEGVAGSIGDFGAFSFFPSKNLGGFGDGGMLTARWEPEAARAKAIRVHGQSSDYEHRQVGGNFRLDALQAAVLSVKLKHLDAWTEARQMNAALYDEVFECDEHLGLLERPYVADYTTNHVYNQYTLRIKDGKRDKVAADLKSKGIGCAVYYPKPLHLQECFSHLRYRVGDFPEAELASQEVLSIPIYPELTNDELLQVADAIKDALK